MIQETETIRLLWGYLLVTSALFVLCLAVPEVNWIRAESENFCVTIGRQVFQNSDWELFFEGMWWPLGASLGVALANAHG